VSGCAGGIGAACRRSGRSWPKLDPFIGIIDQILEDEQAARRSSGIPQSEFSSVRVTSTVALAGLPS